MAQHRHPFDFEELKRGQVIGWPELRQVLIADGVDPDDSDASKLKLLAVRDQIEAHFRNHPDPEKAGIVVRLLENGRSLRLLTANEQRAYAVKRESKAKSGMHRSLDISARTPRALLTDEDKTLLDRQLLRQGFYVSMLSKRKPPQLDGKSEPKQIEE